MTSTRLRAVGWTLVCVLAVVVGSGAAQASSGSCIHARLPEAVLLPDGTEHGPGRITLCHTRDFSPVVSLHETVVDGTSAGLMRARRGRSEGPGTEEPYVSLLRGADGRLVLYGYAVPARGHMDTFRLIPIPGRSEVRPMVIVRAVLGRADVAMTAR